MDPFVERDTGRFTVSFFNFDNELEAPLTARYKVFDKATGTILVAWTAISPVATTVTITLTPAQNRILDDDLDEEIHVILVEGTYASAQVSKQRLDFVVENFAGIP